MSSSPPPDRLEALDVFRGLIILLMALDHAALIVGGPDAHYGRELWSRPFMAVGPEQMAAFLTRAVTHICTPGFALLMGAAMTLFAAKRRALGWDGRRILVHFGLRGALLILLQLFVENAAWWLTMPPGQLTVYWGVLAMLGGCMLLAAPLLRLNAWRLAGLGLVCLLFEWLLMLLVADPGTAYAPVLRIIAFPGFTDGFFSLYPLLPWLGVTLLGACLGRLLADRSGLALTLLVPLGVLLLAVYLPLRLNCGVAANLAELPINGHWWSLLYVIKYPPSASFLALTLGAVALLLGLIHLTLPWWRLPASWLALFGRVPLFFYLTHLYVYIGLRAVLTPQGTDLTGAYVAWVGGVALLTPLCLGYDAFKRRRPAASVWRLL